MAGCTPSRHALPPPPPPDPYTRRGPFIGPVPPPKQPDSFDGLDPEKRRIIFGY
ncbi:hypothetical protein TIFTF001_031446 [Ficus carica]|uniref:Uncharacterized protein n=1 Tax=Ficus carica TaxID=3494 RepID=A0AA88J474_FICCA|nr:hypothetical protein TIFTF001_031446 [Ficus carica]